jgi:hypothetical protein
MDIPQWAQTNARCHRREFRVNAEAFIEWTGALERADVLRTRLLLDSWIDVT